MTSAAETLSLEAEVEEADIKSELPATMEMRAAIAIPFLLFVFVRFS
jgi:hypothetical protein